jgi:diguanylate cyclase (GGDEF)-like protein/PAS domain S-box-containing protein
MFKPLGGQEIDEAQSDHRKDTWKLPLVGKTPSQIIGVGGAEFEAWLREVARTGVGATGTSDLEQMMSDVLDTVLSIFDCDRAWLVFPCDPDAATWHSGIERTRPEYPGLWMGASELPTDAGVAATWRILLAANGPVTFGPEADYPLSQETSQLFGVRSFIAMVVYPKGGKPWVFGLHQCSSARVWTAADEKLFSQIGQRLADGLTILLAFRNVQNKALVYRSIAENSPDMIARVDRDGRYIYVNPVVAELSGMPREAFIGKMIGETRIAAGLIADERTVVPLRAVVREAVATGTSQRCVVNAADGPGGMTLDFSVTPERDETGQVASVLYIARDVTQLKRNVAAQTRLNRALRLLSHCNQLLIHADDESKLLNDVCSFIAEAGQYLLVVVFMERQEVSNLLYVNAPVEGGPQGLNTGVVNWDDSQWGGGPTDDAIRTGEVQLVQDYARDPRVAPWRESMVKRGVRSSAALPIKDGDGTFGALTVCAAEPGAFIAEEVELLRELAGDLAYGIRTLRTRAEHRQLYASVKRHAAELQVEIDQRREAEYRSARLYRVSTVLSAINSLVVRVRDAAELYREACRIAVDIGMFTKAWIGLVDPESKRMEIVAAVGGDEYFVQLRPLLANGFREGHLLFDGIMKERRPLVLNDIEREPGLTDKGFTLASGSRALVWLPLVTAGETEGVFALHAAEAGFFDHEELKLLQELAGDVAFARNHIAQEQRLNHLAYYDLLTDLANSGLFHDRLEQYVSAASLARDKVALVLLDLSRFKTINDTLGRHAGDALLKQVAARLRACVQDSTQLARIGADHFAVVIPNVKGESDAMRMFDECYQQCFGEPFLLDGEKFRMSAVGGIALYPNDALTAELLNGNAEAALRRAKGGRDRVLFYNQRMSDAVAEKLALENKLRQALDRDEFVLQYQPKVDLETGRIEGVEALIRWNSPDLGLVPPEQFIPLMEETGLIVEVGYWTLCRAALDHEAWLAQGVPAPRIAVNVSAVQLRKQDFAALVQQVLSRGVVSPGIDIEITESLLMEDIDASVEKLHALRQLGVNVAIDDFGTGYSSLAYLAKLPAQILKIDRTFISTMLSEPDVMTLVSTMITLAHALRLKVVAEGVETADESQALRHMGCDQIQGYLVSRPISFDAMSSFIRDGMKQAIR